MSQLDLYFIGSPRVSLDGNPVRIDRRKVLALLVYLAVTSQRHSRDELAELLYGRQDRAHSHSNLRQTLSLLRTAIGREHIGTDRLGVWMPCRKNIWIDVVEFRHLRKIGETADFQGDLSSTISSFSKAVELFHGEFLSGFYLKDSTDFEDWQLLEQENLRRQQASLLQRLVEIHGERSQYEKAIDYGHKLLALDPLEESVHRQLMRLNSLNGQHIEALRQYERCRSVLKRELGESPEDETEGLHENILARKLLPEHQNLTQGLQQIPTPDNRPGNFQIQPTSFIERKKELSLVRGTLSMEKVRLLTLTGAGGIGKTRLAQQAAVGMSQNFVQGVFFVDLAAIHDPNHVVGAIAAVLNVRETGDESRSQLDMLKDYLGTRQVLLLLDNFEHLLSSALQVAVLLASCPNLKVLTTSREALRLRGERVLKVSPMELPSQGQNFEVMKRSEAVQLFTERATAVRSTFTLTSKNIETVAEICIRLDGLPLAIELAAMHIKILTPRALLTKLKNRLNLLKGGPRDLPERQQTLRNEIDWSYDLLKPEERRIFMELSVFPVGCTLDAAEAVCFRTGGEPDIFSILSLLTEKSLVRLVESNGEPRFRMLETIREYARERLMGSGELDALESRFAAYFLQFAEQGEPELYGPDQIQWFERIEDEYGNIQRALSWLYDQRNLVDGLRLAGSLGWFWFRRARFSEGQSWLELFRDAVGEIAPPGTRAKAAYYLGWMRLCVSSVWGNPEGKPFFKESLRLWREVGNKRGIALSQVWLAWKEGDIEGRDGWILADDSVAIARETEEPWVIAWCLKVAYAHLRRKDKTLICRKEALKEAIDIARKVQDPFLLSQMLNGMGNVFNWIRELESAEPWYLDSLRIAREIGDSWSILENIYYLADGNLGLGRISKAKELFTEGLRLSLDYGARGYLAWFIGGFYALSKREGRSLRALKLGAFSELILNPDGRYDPYLAEELDLDEELAATEWEKGQAMTMEQAVDYALMEE